MPISISVPEDLDFKPRITVVGVGGGGCNAVDHMIEGKLEGVSFVACNTDLQALRRSTCPVRIRLGLNRTQGLGAGSNPAVGCEAAEESLDEVMDAIGDTHMLFIVAGFGGGTGTGAAPVIARAAHQRGILTVAVVTTPFTFEAVNRTEVAQAGLLELQDSVDTFVVIANQKLFDVQTEGMSLLDSFRLVDNVLHDGVRGISDLLMCPGLINLDFADVRSAMKDAGAALMGTGEATGDDRIEAATHAAINNPLLSGRGLEMDQATSLLVNITSSADVSLTQTERIMEIIRERTHERVNLKVGVAINDEMGDAIRVSVVMAGLDRHDRAALDSIAPGIPGHAPKPRPEFRPEPSSSAPPPARQGGLGGAGPEAGRGEPAGPRSPVRAAPGVRARIRVSAREGALGPNRPVPDRNGFAESPTDPGRHAAGAGGPEEVASVDLPPGIRDQGGTPAGSGPAPVAVEREVGAREPATVGPEGPLPAPRTRDALDPTPVAPGDPGRAPLDAVGKTGPGRAARGNRATDGSASRDAGGRASYAVGTGPELEGAASPDRAPGAGAPPDAVAAGELRPAVQLNAGNRKRSSSRPRWFRLFPGRRKAAEDRREPSLQPQMPSSGSAEDAPSTVAGLVRGPGPEEGWGDGEPVSARAVLGIDPRQIPSFRR